jgi:selenocysteine-specific elongation factor
MTSQIKSVVIGTAGHIDHGKTALVRALTGIDTDRLPEEKRRGITIDLGFAFLAAASAGGSPLRISFVDVPGHSLFIHNMLAGAGCIGAAMLVISAEEGIKPQTVEHLAICELLGVQAGLTVITKVDAAGPERVAEVEREAAKFLRGSFLGRAEIFKVSAVTGQGLIPLRQRIIALAEESPEGDLEHVPRLPIDRAFSMKGFGTVVTGTLLAGNFSAGQSITLQPGGRAVRVRGMQSHGQAERLAIPGSRVALNLTGVEVSDVSRGQTLVAPETLIAVNMVDVEAWLLPGSASLKHGSQVHFHAFTSNTVGKVLLYGSGRFEADSKRLARIKLQDPIVLNAGDPFVLRQVSPAATIGGGRTLDANPISRLRKMQAMEWLAAMRDATPEERLRLRIARRGSEGLSLQHLMAETGLTQEATQRIVGPLIVRREVVQIPSDVLIDLRAFDTAGLAVLRAVSQHTKGLKRSELQSRASFRSGMLDSLLEHLAGAGKLRLDGELIYPKADGVKGSAADPALEAVATIYQRAGLTAPLVSEVVAMLKRSEKEVRGLITLLLREKTLVPIGTDNLFMHQDALAQLRAQISELRGQTLDVARFKQITGLSRKYAIPLLEYLDRQRITRKSGDQRVVL